MLHIAAIVALASFAAAQVPQLNLSLPCLTTALNVVTDPDVSACLSPVSLLDLIGSTGSITPTIDGWVESMCAGPVCSDSLIATVATNITTACKDDLNLAFGNTSLLATSLAPALEIFYPTVREVACLKDGNINCINQTLAGVEAVIGPLTIASITSLVGSIISGGLPALPAGLICTDCIKASFNIIAHDVGGIVNPARPIFQQSCGATFLDGQTPVTIVGGLPNGTSSNGTRGSTAATALSISGLVASTLVVVSAIVILL